MVCLVYYCVLRLLLELTVLAQAQCASGSVKLEWLKKLQCVVTFFTHIILFNASFNQTQVVQARYYLLLMALIELI